MRTAVFRPTAPRSISNGHPAGPAAATASATTSAGPVRLSAVARRRRPALWLLSAALIAGGALLAVDAARSAGHKIAVLVAVHDVGAGERIEAADLAVVHVSTDPGLKTIPAANQPAVVGAVASVDLKAGSLLLDSELSGTGVPSTGTVVIGIALKPGQLPARGLTRGDRVLVVNTPSPDQGGSAQPSGSQQTQTPPGASQPASPASFGAVVQDSTPGPAADGSTLVDVVAEQNTAAALASDAASGHVALLLLPRKP